MTAQSPATIDAWSIFVHSRSAVTSARYPWRLDYTVAVSGLDGLTPVEDHYRASCDPADGTIRVAAISNERIKDPPVPRGVGASVTFGICIRYGGCAGYAIPAGHPSPYQDLIGEPLIAPTYMFGLRYGGVPYSTKPVGVESALPVIATVSTKNRQYEVTLAGKESIGGVATYHLQLKPLRRPKENRLRELWVGTNDFLPRQAVVFGNFTIAPLVDVPWTIEFTVVDGAPLVTRETTPNVLYLQHHRIVRDAVIAFEDVREPGSALYGEPLIAPQPDGTALLEPMDPLL